MADSKSSFILYCDLIHTVEKLPDEKAGELFKHILRYVNDQDPQAKDFIIEIAFEPIKQQLKRDLRDWELTKLDRSTNGKLGNLKRWHPDLFQRVLSEEITPEQALSIATDRPRSTPIANVANVAVNVNDTVNVSESVMYSLDHCLFVAMKDETWVMNAKANEGELKIFNTFLLGSGVNEKHIADYKKHFNNWKRKDPPELKLKVEPKEKLTAPPLKRLA